MHPDGTNPEAHHDHAWAGLIGYLRQVSLNRIRQTQKRTECRGIAYRVIGHKDLNASMTNALDN